MPTPTDLTFRPFQSDADLAAMVRVHELRRDADQVDPLSTRESWMTLERAQWNANWTGDPVRNMRFAEMRGETIGYAMVVHWNEPNLAVFLLLAYVIPAGRHKPL